MIELRILDPQRDLDLFRESYGWRPKPKRHIQPDRGSFKDFIDTDPRQIVVGVFNGSFIAAFLLYEWQPAHYEAHFTSKRGTPRESLIEGGKMIRDAFLQNGAQELCAWVTERNIALKGYLEALGFELIESKRFACQNDTEGRKLPFEQRLFVKYAISRIPP